ncbi:MAG: alanine racemase [Micrococcaceae bacterium]|jgi:pyridoxal phosphate enzyme (YggS family)|nr:alanine racemase [Micrococcaceae bacterium]
MPSPDRSDGVPNRARDLAANLARVQARISAAGAGRAAGMVEPRLIVVTKFHPASDVVLLRDLGVQDVGENRDQEAAAKAADVAAATGSKSSTNAPVALRWHFIGQLQSNKAKSVVRYAAAVHSIDRPQLVRALSTAMQAEQDRTGRPDLGCFVQVNLDPAASARTETGAGAGRGGALPEHVLELAARIDNSPGLQLQGVMAVAPLGADAREAFTRLAEISAQLRGRFPAAGGISAGMSADLEDAIACGATHLRVGSDVLGPRPAVR